MKTMKRKIDIFLYLIIISFFLPICCIKCYAKDSTKNFKNNQEINQNNNEEFGESNYDFSEINQFVNNNIESEKISFSAIVKKLLAGKSENIFKNIINGLGNNLFYELKYNKLSLQKIIIIALVSALFTNFSKVFSNNQISETGFNISYLLITALLISSFGILSKLTFEIVTKLLDFMKALLPVYMVSVGVAVGQAGASSFYSIALIVVTIVEVLCLKIMLPIINIYVVIELINNISKEDFLSKLAQLIRMSVSFCIKLMLTLVLGMNVIQGMLVPVSGSIRNNATKGIVGILSGSLATATSVTGLLYGTGSLIKNAIGGAGLIVIATLILVPIIKIVVFIFAYQLSNVIIQPVSDKRITNSVQGVINGAVLLLRTIFMCAILFTITIAIICITTN